MFDPLDPPPGQKVAAYIAIALILGLILADTVTSFFEYLFL